MGEDLSSLLSTMAELEIENKDKNLISGTADLVVDAIASHSSFERRNGRSMRTRSASEDSLHRTRNRKVEKPKKNTTGALHFETEKEVKNFYLNINKKVKLKPVLLETIYEKDETLSDNEDPANKEIGRKTKRALAICDGFNITKSLKKKREGLIKKHLGGKKKPKKIALAKFMEYFKQKATDTEVIV